MAIMEEDDVAGKLYELDPVMVAVVTVAVVVQVEDDVDEAAATAAAAAAAPTISAISSENRREGEKAREGLKAISRPSSVSGETLGGLVRLNGDTVDDDDFVEEAVVVAVV